MSRQSDEEFVAQLQQRLSESTNELAPDVLSRLKQARADAVKTATKQTDGLSLPFPSWLAPASTATAFASLGFVVVMLWTQPDSFSQSASPTFIKDIAVLSSPDDLELFENLDFYIWLENEDIAS